MPSEKEDCITIAEVSIQGLVFSLREELALKGVGYYIFTYPEPERRVLDMTCYATNSRDLINCFIQPWIYKLMALEKYLEAHELVKGDRAKR